MKKITEMAHIVLAPYIHAEAICADFTAGNGNDTLFFCERAQKGFVYAFDIQKEAVRQCEAVLKVYPNVKLILDNHIHMENYIHEQLDAAIFNFGYLPNSASTLVSEPQTSLIAVQRAFALCKRHALLVLVCYPGHEIGEQEAQCISEWCHTLKSDEARIMKIAMVNKPHAPFLYAIEKL